jgi:beta-glucanase (GH16 family)
MTVRNLVRRVQHLERQHHPTNYTFVWQDQNGQYSVNGETMDEATYQRWYDHQGSNKIVYIFAWR